MKFIILDDDEILKDTIYCYLEGKGHSVERTSKEEEVFTLINKKQIDVVVADSSMLNGKNLLKILQEEKPQIKVILINGTANKKNHLYRQPSAPRELYKVIEEINKIIERQGRNQMGCRPLHNALHKAF